tara:strand:- start:16548 stop:16985 length:438 start_codon:yes stop_codon:yes gene_type:complete
MATQQKRIADIMSKDVEFVRCGTSLADAAKKMQELDCGFLPISDTQGNKLLGVVTDRDIVLRGVALGKDPQNTTVDDVCGNQVLYCFATDLVERAASSMQEQQIYRLVVLDHPDTKKLCGVISLNDIVRHDERMLAMAAVQGIAA